jgi:hypothetical protein
MTGVLALAQGLGFEGLTPYWPYAGAFLGSIMLLSAGLVVGRRLLSGRPSHGYVLDINAVAQAHGATARPLHDRGAAAPRRADAA